MKLPPGYSVSWSGQFEYLQRAAARLKLVIPATLLIIFVLLYLNFRRIDESLLIMATLPFALVGGFWLIWLLGYNLSIATAVGFIALAGVATEIGVVMLVYVNQAVVSLEASTPELDAAGLRAAVEASLVALDTDRIDVYHLHGVGDDEYEKFARMVERRRQV